MTQLVDPGVMAALDALSRAIAALDHKFDAVHARIDTLEAKMDRRFNALETKVDKILDLLT